MSRTVFTDRRAAGRFLADLLHDYAGRPHTIVLALPRGGVPVGFEVAAALHVPLDVFGVRKLGVPGHEELAMGAIAANGVRVLNDDVLDALDVTAETVDRIAEAQAGELARREDAYRSGRPSPDLDGATVILVDDGLATGSTMRAAAMAVRASGAARIVVAVPTGSVRGCEAVGAVADDVICATRPEPFVAVGLSYRNFDQTSDDEVRRLLGTARTMAAARRPGGAAPPE